MRILYIRAVLYTFVRTHPLQKARTWCCEYFIPSWAYYKERRYLYICRPAGKRKGTYCQKFLWALFSVGMSSTLLISEYLDHSVIVFRFHRIYVYFCITFELHVATTPFRIDRFLCQMYKMQHHKGCHMRTCVRPSIRQLPFEI